MTKLRLCLLATAGALMIAGSAQAQDKLVTFTGNLGATTDYVFRGISQTNEQPAIQGGVDASAGIFYTGLWASNVDFGDSTDGELDTYIGVKPVLGPVTLDLGLIYYGYLDAPTGADYGNFEGKAAASFAAGKATVGAAIFYSGDSFGAAKAAAYYEVNAAVPVLETVTIGGAFGHQAYKGAGDYSTWNVGATWALAPHFAFDFRYFDTDEHGFGKLYGERGVISLKASY